MYRSRACSQVIPRLLKTGKCDSCIGLLENVRHLESEDQLEDHKHDSMKEESSSNDFGNEYETFDSISTHEDGHNSEVPQIINFTKKLELIDKVRKNPDDEGPQVLPCEEEGCGKVFSKKERLTVHYKKVHVQKQKCPFCDTFFKKRGISMIKHIKLLHKSQAETEAYKNFFLETAICICPQCGKEYPKEFIKHHTCTYEYVSCHICGKNVRSVYHQQHIERHQKHNVEVCPHCGKFFDNKIRFQNHVQKAHLDKGSFPCPECEKVFPTKAGRSSLNEHIRKVHRQETKHECDQCEKKYFKKKQLLEHIRAVHDQIKAFRCEKCEFRTAKHSNLNIHRKKSHNLDWMGRLAMMEMIQSGRHPYIDTNYEYIDMIRPKKTVILNKI